MVERFNMQDRNVNSHSTSYRSGHPIDSIKQGDPDDHSPAQENRTHAYQSLVGSIGWLTQITRPNLAAVHSFLSSYTKCPLEEMCPFQMRPRFLGRSGPNPRWLIDG